jgi:hypothetical protein
MGSSPTMERPGSAIESKSGAVFRAAHLSRV